MLRTSKAGRMARGLAAAALIFSLSVTTFAGSANAAPLADCSEAAHARNDATHLLHSAWKVFNGDLKDLASEARALDKQSRKDKSSTVMTTDARAEVASAKAELKSISSQAKADLQAEVELGTACQDEEDADDSTTTTTTTTTSTSTTAPSDATAPADSTGSAHTFDTSGLDEKYKDIVEQAIEDMQAVVDEARKAVMDMAAAAETTETTDDAEATTELKSAKAEREKAKEVREEAKAEAKGKSKDKSEAKSSASKGNGKSKHRK